MRFAVFLLLMIPLSFPITYWLDLFTEASCPGDIITVDAITSNGQPAPDVELRLVLYEPYQGLRALKHTNAHGQTFFELTKNGTYRIYITTDVYHHDKYVTFEYPEMCPAPPSKQMVVGVELNCDSRLMKINITDGISPLENVFVQSKYWSTMSGSSGTVVLPLEEDDYFLYFDRRGYNSGTFLFVNPCPEP